MIFFDFFEQGSSLGTRRELAPVSGWPFADTGQQKQPRGNGYLIGLPLPCRLFTSRQRVGSLNTVQGKKYLVAQQERHTPKAKLGPVVVAVGGKFLE